jgi:hypothetical protein
VLLGDLNLQPGRARPILEAAGFHVTGELLTYPVAAPRIKLDYIACDEPGIVEHDAVATAVSDHCALVATRERGR